MNATDAFRFLHVLSAIIWVGGGAMMQLLINRATELGPETTAEFSKAAEWTSQHVFMPAAFSALGFGIATVAAGGYDWAAMWIGLGFAGFLVSALIGTAILGPTYKKMAALAAERGPHDPVVTHMARRIQFAGRVDLIILIAVVFVMVVKPGQ